MRMTSPPMLLGRKLLKNMLTQIENDRLTQVGPGTPMGNLMRRYWVPVLQSGEIDVLIRDSTLTLTRNPQLGLSAVTVNFFTGQAFMVKKSLNVAHVKELDGATICVLTGTTLELNIADFGRANNIKINTLLFEKSEEAFAAAEAGRCDGYTDDGGSVAAARWSPRRALTGASVGETKEVELPQPDGSTAKRLPGFKRWLWDGEFCGSIGLRWQPGTTALPPHCLGHIGYAVVPWKRRRGYATQALRDCSFELRAGEVHQLPVSEIDEVSDREPW